MRQPCFAVAILRPTVVGPPVYNCGLSGTQLSPREPTTVNRSFTLGVMVFFYKNRDKSKWLIT
jgi:hypothetical protein